MDITPGGSIKCHKCRHIVLEDLSAVLNNKMSCNLDKCNSYDFKNFIYISEDRLPEWIKCKVEEEQWTKGKLNCEQCGCKVGSFDYISGRKCDCRSSILPPVHLVSSQVDRPITIVNVLQSDKQ